MLAQQNKFKERVSNVQSDEQADKNNFKIK